MQGILGSLFRKEGTITGGPPASVINKTFSPAKLETIGEDVSLNTVESSATPPDDQQSASPTPKPATPSPPRTPSKE